MGKLEYTVLTNYAFTVMANRADKIPQIIDEGEQALAAQIPCLQSLMEDQSWRS
jgi:hypothetical protein